MTQAKELCEKIRSIYPEIGECGGDVEVRFDDTKKAWAVDLNKGQDQLTTYLDEDETNACLEGEKCLPLGVKVSQLVDNSGR